MALNIVKYPISAKIEKRLGANYPNPCVITEQDIVQYVYGTKPTQENLWTKNPKELTKSARIIANHIVWGNINDYKTYRWWRMVNWTKDQNGNVVKRPILFLTWFDNRFGTDLNSTQDIFAVGKGGKQKYTAEEKLKKFVEISNANPNVDSEIVAFLGLESVREEEKKQLIDGVKTECRKYLITTFDVPPIPANLAIQFTDSRLGNFDVSVLKPDLREQIRPAFIAWENAKLRLDSLNKQLNLNKAVKSEYELWINTINQGIQANDSKVWDNLIYNFGATCIPIGTRDSNGFILQGALWQTGKEYDYGAAGDRFDYYGTMERCSPDYSRKNPNMGYTEIIENGQKVPFGTQGNWNCTANNEFPSSTFGASGTTYEGLNFGRKFAFGSVSQICDVGKLPPKKFRVAEESIMTTGWQEAARNEQRNVVYGRLSYLKNNEIFSLNRKIKNLEENLIPTAEKTLQIAFNKWQEVQALVVRYLSYSTLLRQEAERAVTMSEKIEAERKQKLLDEQTKRDLARENYGIERTKDQNKVLIGGAICLLGAFSAINNFGGETGKLISLAVGIGGAFYALNELRKEDSFEVKIDQSQEQEQSIINQVVDELGSNDELKVIQNAPFGKIEAGTMGRVVVVDNTKFMTDLGKAFDSRLNQSNFFGFSDGNYVGYLKNSF
jgi:hypothetical protein